MSAHDNTPTGRRVALVLAGSKGLGRACADALADSGFDVVVCARSADDTDATVAALRERGSMASGVTADVSSADDLERLFAHVDEVHGRLDVLVANAGGPPPGPILDLDDDDWRTGFELTLMSAVRAIRHAVPRMRASGYGRIVVLGSSSVRQPIPNLGLSNAYRPALAGVVKSLSVDLAPEGITVNMVSPGRVATERVASLDQRAAEREGISAADARARSEATIPMGRYGQPEELGAMVAFLAGPSAGYVTGETILVDGGLVRSLP